MRYVCDVLYAVLYVSISCFVVHGCAVSRRYINVCNCYFSMEFYLLIKENSTKKRHIKHE